MLASGNTSALILLADYTAVLCSFFHIKLAHVFPPLSQSYDDLALQAGKKGC